MKKAFILFVIPLFLVVGNVAAADLEGTWEAYSEWVVSRIFRTFDAVTSSLSSDLFLILYFY